MPALVLDASALLAPFDPEGDDLALALEDLLAEHDALAPAPLLSELGNVVFGHRRARFGTDHADRLDTYANLLAPLRIVPGGDDHRRAAARIAEARRITFYDAEYVALAAAEGAVLVTEDRGLLDAARKELGPRRAMGVAKARRELGEGEA